MIDYDFHHAAQEHQVTGQFAQFLHRPRSIARVLLLAQQCYEWGNRSVHLLIEKLVEKKNPPAVKEVSALIPVTKDNVDAFAKNWDKWLPK